MLGSDRLADVTAGDATQRTKFFCLQVSGWPIVSRDRAKVIALTEKQGAESGFAELCRIRQHGLKDRPQLAGGRADNAQHLRCCGLLLQRLPKLIEQPRVLDGDDGLGSEILHQRDLSVGEWPDLLAEDLDDADRRAFFEHWHRYESAHPAKFNHIYAGWIALFVTRYLDGIIERVHDPLRREGAPKRAQWVRVEPRPTARSDLLGVGGRDVVHRDGTRKAA